MPSFEAPYWPAANTGRPSCYVLGGNATEHIRTTKAPIADIGNTALF